MARPHTYAPILLLLAIAGCEPGGEGATVDPQTAAAADSGFSAATDEFFSGMFARSPVSATMTGAHEHDAKWPDLSPEGRAEQAAWVAQMLTRFEGLSSHASKDQEVDAGVLRDVLLRMQLGAEVENDWTTNPLSYAYLIGGGLDGLVARDFAPVDERGASVAARLEGLPSLVEQAITNLADPALVKAPQAKVALGQMGGLSLLISEEIPKRLSGASDPVKQRVSAATPAALEALKKLSSHIETQVLPNAEGEWRLGADAFSRKLQLTLQTDLSAAEVYALATKEHAAVRERMDVLARELYVPLFGQAKLDAEIKKGGDDLGQRIIKRVLAELAKDHVEASALRDACEENLARLGAFVTDAKIVPTDEREVLEVIWTPPHERGVAIAGLDAPPPLDAAKPGLPSFYLVQPVPEDWPEKRRESFLREYNHFMLEILSIHEAIPGHFVQLYYGKREPSRPRAVFSNGPFVEGWAVYMERVMVEEGYSGQGPSGDKPAGMSAGLWKVKTSPELRAKAIALHGQKFYLRTVTNAIIDHEIHAGDMNEAQAVEFMVDRAFQEEGEARAKWVRAQISSTQLSTYFVGAAAWFRLREQAEARAGAAGEPFVLSDFHGEVLSHGAPPVHRLPELIGW